MKQLWSSILLLMLLLASGAWAAYGGKSQAQQEDDMREAIVRFWIASRMNKPAPKDRTPLYISMRAGKKSKDPSDEWIARFKGSHLPVRKGSQRKAHERAAGIWFDDVHWKDEDHIQTALLHE